MATQADLSIDVQAQLASMRRDQVEAEKLAAESRKLLSEQLKFASETRYMPPSLIFQAMLATAALLAAGAAVAKLLLN